MPSLRHARLPPRAPSPGHPPRHLKHSAVRRFSPESEDGGCCCAGLTFAAYCGDRILSEVQDKWTDVLVWCAAAPSPQSSCPAHLALQLQCWREVSAVALSPHPDTVHRRQVRGAAPGADGGAAGGAGHRLRPHAEVHLAGGSGACPPSVLHATKLRIACVINAPSSRITGLKPAAAAFSYLGCPFPVALSS